ncbi:MAG: ATP-binding cassette domain-containing protein [Candidatus Hodarchaeales archaeon]|jgi:ABC-type lipoprotein export system ATPase subunit
MERRLIYDPTDLPDDLIIALFNIYKIFRSTAIEHVALRGISLSIHSGDLVSCVGPSGSGKSTLLNVLAGLLNPTAGTVYWRTVKGDLSRFSPSELAPIRNQFMGFINQQPYLLPNISVLKNVMIPGMLNQQIFKSRKHLKRRAIELLKRVGLEKELKNSPTKLSGGEIQRVALATALINNPEIVLADEPTGNLDFETGKDFLDLIDTIREELDTAFLIVTHSPQVAQRTNRILELSDGMLIGHHSSVMNLSGLDHSRTLVLDAQNRVYIPDEILHAINSPSGFFLEREGEKLILDPVTPEKIEQSSLSKRTVICQLCNYENRSSARFCDNCGNFLSKFKLFLEE